MDCLFQNEQAVVNQFKEKKLDTSNKYYISSYNYSEKMCPIYQVRMNSGFIRQSLLRYENGIKISYHQMERPIGFESLKWMKQKRVKRFLNENEAFQKEVRQMEQNGEGAQIFLLKCNPYLICNIAIPLTHCCKIFLCFKQYVIIFSSL
ncbi:unnamed protein product [Paramecium sonneborni]|uniref:Uncharacterized protein n=1 Tax=Paramecium sonneborni TaxID=65129 RepID=A0A8S1RR31_9CILI|nr:unnamed protein product [Paramecium sonneborni]